MTRQRKSHEERKEEIVLGALELAAEVGVKEVTAQAIADRVGIAQPTIFRHFKTRDAIFLAAIERIASILFGVLEGLGTEQEPSDQLMRKFLHRQLLLIGKQRGLTRLLFSDRLHLENPELKKTVRRILERYVGYLTGVLQNGIGTGVFRPELDPMDTARWIAATMQGLIMRWSIYDFGFRLEDEFAPLWQFLEPVLMNKAPDHSQTDRQSSI